MEPNNQSKTVEEGGRANWPPYHWLGSPEIEPIVNEFWRANYEQNDLAMYYRFLEILRLSRSGLNGDSIARSLNINNVRKYITGQKMSFLTRLRSEHDRLGTPRLAHNWLPLHLRPRGTPGDEWVEVPTNPLRFTDIQSLIERMKPTPVEPQLLANFGLNSNAELKSERTNMFGFLLGAFLGDASKPVKGSTRFPSMTTALTLSKDKPNSLRFGEFTAICANASIGLAMHRIRDAPSSSHRFTKAECYRWISAATPLIAWIFHELLGLEAGDTTTRNRIRMDWVFGAPRVFRISIVQGLAESDGWPDPGADDVKLVSSPNTESYKQLLESLGCHPQIVEQQRVELLRCTTEEANQLPFFNPRIASNQYRSMKILASAERYPERLRLPQKAIDIIRELSLETSNSNEVCLRLAERTGFKVSGETVRKYSKS